MSVAQTIVFGSVLRHYAPKYHLVIKIVNNSLQILLSAHKLYNVFQILNKF